MHWTLQRLNWAKLVQNRKSARNEGATKRMSMPKSSAQGRQLGKFIGPNQMGHPEKVLSQSVQFPPPTFPTRPSGGLVGGGCQSASKWQAMSTSNR